ncbi:uncharacterized protein LOC127879388 [Dreissena polymorpha]|uniref:Uncharacterized protein n=1 Tax=Dreissena polymorpha TaxID=45954 RepID=A0A9D4K533_DREPO|nr:uncharacterized protein LOC127879388 [Dreissena polymorpha]KAH3833196.1 hypothetical protein DPMN_106499 [Dreissena polymorpha]
MSDAAAPPQTQPGYGYDQQYGMPRVQQYGPPVIQNQSTVIVTQPFPTMGVVVQQQPPDYTVAAVLVCLFCFFPTGVAAIIFAMMASSQWSAGEYQEARRSSTIARNLVIASLVIGILAYVLIIALYYGLVVYATDTLSDLSTATEKSI